MKFKWTDAVQAQERIQGTYMMYGKDVVYINEVRSSGINITFCPNGGSKTVPYDDDNWNDFRGIPPLGWVNVIGGPAPNAVFVSRHPVRGRRHGLYGDVVSIRSLVDNALQRSREFDLTRIFNNPGYSSLLENDYPGVDEILERLPRRASTAMSRKYAVYRDAGGVAWLFRKAEQVGFLTKSVLNVFPDTSFYSDEIKEIAPNLSIRDLV